MNLLARTKATIHVIPLLHLTKRPFLIHPINALQQCNSYSAKTSYNTQKTQQVTKPRTPKPSEPSTNVAHKIKEQTGRANVWPKPKEIPFQAKVANCVNLIGYVKNPVQVKADDDGKRFAATVISQGTSDKRSLLIPVVFEGDLVNVVERHVKENDCVFISGQLSLDPLRSVFNESLGKFHVVAENLNFVEGYSRNVYAKNIGVSFSDVEIDKPVGKNIEEVTETVANDEGFNQQWKEALEHAKGKSFTVENSVKPVSNDVEAKTLVHDEFKQEKANEKGGGKKRNGDVVMDLWRNLVKNPLQWWDYRDHKAKGLVKEKYPDFKQKETGEGLWINTAPNWVLPGFEKLEFDVMEMHGGEKKVSKGEDLWRNLVENPTEWRDNRLGKRNPKSPDFKHKETGEGLWIDRAPSWVLPRFEKLEFDVMDSKQVGEKKEAKGEDLWRNLVENPNEWWDNRLGKRNPKSPDFKHKESGKALWLSDVPDWAMSRLPPSKEAQDTA